MEIQAGQHLHNLKRSVRKHFGDFLAKISAVWKSRKEPGPITDDSARSDGGNTTENRAVSSEKLKDLAHTAIDHTREESGS